MTHSQQALAAAASAFDLAGPLEQAAAHGSGHIHDTYRLVCRTPAGDVREYCLQRLNEYVFPRLDLVAENVGRVTTHLRQRLGGADVGDFRGTLNVVPTHDGAPLWRDDEGRAWRVFDFVQNSVSYDVVHDEVLIERGSEAFGRFLSGLGDLPPDELHDTIPHFHDTPRRYAALREAIEQNRKRRKRYVEPEIDFLLAHEDLAESVLQGLAQGTLPRRSVHNDTKINNVLFDATSQQALCVIDLDTVMAGSPLYDLGEMTRTATGGFAENERDESRIKVDLRRFELLVRGFLEGAPGYWSEPELELFPAAGPLLTLENAVRFLTDYLMGDQYFRIHYPVENRDRARAMIAFVKSMEAHREDMRAIVAKVREEL